jgi:hypothetical protein
MVGELMTLPVRTGVRVTRFAVRTGLTLSFRALALASDAVSSVTGRGSAGASSWPAPKPPERHADDATSPPERHADDATSPPERHADDAPASPETADLATVPPAWTDEPLSPLVEEPAHVSEEPVVVEEFAEPGAEDGAGAQVTIDEPWDGYAQMTARDITARLGDASQAELAAVQLYESTHKQRETVVSAVERELRAKTAPGG